MALKGLAALLKSGAVGFSAAAVNRSAVRCFPLFCSVVIQCLINIDRLMAALDDFHVKNKKKQQNLAFIIDICWFFSALTASISTYITATCLWLGAASTIKPAKLFLFLTPQSDLQPSPSSAHRPSVRRRWQLPSVAIKKKQPERKMYVCACLSS